MKKGINLLDKNALTKIILDDNGLDDKNLSCLLKGLATQEDVKSIVITRNVIDKKSSAQLVRLLQRGFPKNLDELRITECKVSSAALNSILTAVKEKMFLRKLSIVNASMNEHNNLALVRDIIEQSKMLIDLDISWNELRPQNIKGIIEALSKNRTLQYVNLSWNNIQNK